MEVLVERSSVKQCGVEVLSRGIGGLYRLGEWQNHSYSVGRRKCTHLLETATGHCDTLSSVVAVAVMSEMQLK